VPRRADDALTVDVAAVLGDDGRRDVSALLGAAQETDGYSSLSDRARLRLEAAAPNVVLLSCRAARGLAGFSVLEHSDGRWVLETAVEPRARALPVFSTLVDAALAEVAIRGGGRVGAWHRGAADGGEAAMARAGLRADRVLLQLRAPLPLAAEEGADARGVDVRPFDVGRDEAAWLEVNRRAFAGHPEQGVWTLEDLERREGEGWFDPGGFLLHEVDGRLAAFCWTKVHREPPLGEIYVIGVDPDFQGRGLGRALTLAGLEHLATRGIPTAMLYVEATNTPALVLYRSLGFAEHHREVLYDVVVAGQLETPTARPMP
jgi:mycothiol synthase